MNIAPLKGTSAFASTIRTGKRFVLQHVTAIVKFHEYSGTNNNLPNEIIAVGVSIRKKTAKKASVRNRIKRLLRQSVRQVFTEWNEQHLWDDYCPFERIIFFCNAAPKAASLVNLNDILPHVRLVLLAAFDYSKQRQKRHENNSHPHTSGI